MLIFLFVCNCILVSFGNLEQSKDSRVAFSTKKNMKEAGSLDALEGGSRQKEL